MRSTRGTPRLPRRANMRATRILGDDESPRIDRWYVVSRREQYDWSNMIHHKVIWHDNEAAAGLSSKGGYDGFDFGIAPGACCDRLHFGRSGSSLEIAEVIGSAPWRRIGIKQHSDPP